MITNGVNNFSKKQVSCKDNFLEKSFRAENVNDVENMGNRVEDLHGEMSYISEDSVEGFVGESGFDQYTYNYYLLKLFRSKLPTCENLFIVLISTSKSGNFHFFLL